MLISLRGKLLTSFSFFMFLGLLLISTCLIYNDRVRKLDSISIQAERIYSNILMDQKVIGDFLKYAPTSSEFHSKENLPDLEIHRTLLETTLNDLNVLDKDMETQLNELPLSFSKIKDLLTFHDQQIQQIRTLLLDRGYRSFGVEGAMRVNAHKLEIIQGFDKTKVLNLRRREKDFIIRNDQKYVKLFLEESKLMLKQLEGNNALSNSNKNIAKYHMNSYIKNFLELVEYEKKIGLRDNTNLKQKLDESQAEIKKNIEFGIQQIENKKAELLDLFKILLATGLIFIFLAGIVVSIYLAQLLTKRINILSTTMNKFVQNDFQEDSEELAIEVKEDEIGKLIQNFYLLRSKISSYIEELKEEKEAADRANKSKSLFLANMSHEIRTPMNGVIGITQLLESSEMNPQQEEYIKILKVSGQKLLGIINDILDFSKIESGQLNLEETQLDLREELHKVKQLLEFEASEKKLDFQLNIDKSIPKNLLGDPVRFNQIALNLVSNAIKFTEKGSVNISCSSDSNSEEIVGIKLEVRDTGIGISPDVKNKLFSAFSQADESTTRKFGGTGLGLAITSQLVQLMNGSIHIDSTPGQGSVFTVILPLKKSQNLSKENTMKYSDPIQTPTTRILLVEDNEINQRIAGMMLKRLGCKFSISENGLEALNEVQQSTYDLVFMDIQMPVMDGFTATKEIKKLQADGLIPTFPIIALTANATEEDRNKAKEVKMDGFLTKPIKIQTLKDVIAQNTRLVTS
ncbi:MAG: ATP-binding protein [Bacteroidia bacterium]|nr:ATP-binding protein [Bacteroidia bacterium]